MLRRSGNGSCINDIYFQCNSKWNILGPSPVEDAASWQRGIIVGLGLLHHASPSEAKTRNPCHQIYRTFSHVGNISTKEMGTSDQMKAFSSTTMYRSLPENVDLDKAHWTRTVIAAAGQCMLNTIQCIHVPHTLEQMLLSLSKHRRCKLPYQLIRQGCRSTTDFVFYTRYTG